MRIQRRGVKRIRIYPNVEEVIKKRVQFTAEKFDCSMNFVTNTLLAEVLGIKIDQLYYEDNHDKTRSPIPKKKTRRR